MKTTFVCLGITAALFVAAAWLEAQGISKDITDLAHSNEVLVDVMRKRIREIDEQEERNLERLFGQAAHDIAEALRSL